MIRVITDLNSPWSASSEESISERQAIDEQHANQFKDQHGYIPNSLAGELTKAWKRLNRISTKVDQYREWTRQEME